MVLRTEYRGAVLSAPLRRCPVRSAATLTTKAPFAGEQGVAIGDLRSPTAFELLVNHNGDPPPDGDKAAHQELEQAPTEELFSRPGHEYTRRLLEAIPRPF